MAEYRLYGKPNCSFFSLIGTGEVGQSKSLGFVLSQSKNALRTFVKLVQAKFNSIKWDKNDYTIIDCELRRNVERKESYRADIIIRSYNQSGCSKYAILIETKCKGTKISEEPAIVQIKKYKEIFTELQKFKNVALLTITDIRSSLKKQEDSVLSLTWGELMSAFESINESVVKNYINYLLEIKGNMKQYDKEVLTIPAGQSYDNINTGIYCCPVKEKGPYKKRAESHPLYFAYRQKDSVISELFKIKDIIQIERPVEDNEIREYLADKYGVDFIKNLEQFWKPKKKEYSYVFIFDTSETIVLPRKIRLMKGNAYSKELSLKQILNPDNSITEFA